MPLLPAPPTGRDGVVDWVREHLGHLSCDDVRPSSIRGGQAAADEALAALDVTGYAPRRSTVLPAGSRGASRLSPYIRHGLLDLPTVWHAVEHAPARDRGKFRDELLWQEYSRHLYARVGRATNRPLRFGPPRVDEPWGKEPWPEEMACMAATTAELHEDGWLVNQTRMWLSSQYSVRAGGDWREGAQEMYRHLLDGSPAANRLGWQWTVGTGTGKVYGFSRWQVEKRAPGLCRSCSLERACPVQDWPTAQAGPRVSAPEGLRGGVTDGGPEEPVVSGEADAVWLTGESLGDRDPARHARPDLPTVFVFDEPLLARLRLSGKRLVFLAETLAELGAEVRLGDPVVELQGRRLATTWTYVPGWTVRSRRLEVVATYPWPWLRRPGAGSLQSFSAWVR
ncbi:deoxyribodipyrimidine photo-lyase [Motilibacter peucedani]|uniref:Deoxyribodipyrimidine photo-lyase n=1 Tax=Motilibacter peucedani TaxID=598650 RepID=A0A420XQ02_9ACTN|nr:FAD-binding domain-containing protein [Motilibacter peucedani]RKS75339.1 deoxyribodipyrimidine photo-lyase [Motilibacter peucedani]